MSDAKPQPDPSMEQILASINRIITEDKGGSGAPGEGGRGALDLTEAIAEDGSVRHLTPLAMAASGEAGRGEPPAPQAGEAAAGKPAGGEPGGGAAGDAKPPDGVVSTATAGAAAAAFAELAAAARDRRREGELPLGGGDRTLEAIVREALKPMLQSWLDENLPGVVERLVREEIARAAREAGLR